MREYFCAFVMFSMSVSSKSLNYTACRGVFAKIQFDGRSQQILLRKKFLAQTTTRPRPAITPDQISQNRNLHQTNKK